jgi:AcrR family transcriptional regulator
MDRRLTQRGQDRRSQLMEFAAHRFAENGYHPTSVAEIVQGLGVGKGVFYWYFPSKEDLFLEILRESQYELRRRQQQAIGDQPDPVRRIQLGIEASMEWLAENRHLSTLFQFAATEERFAPALRRSEEVAVGDLARHIKEAIVEGRICDADPLVLTYAVIGVINSLARTFIIERGDPPGRVAQSAVAFCLDGLLGQGGARGA